MTITYRSEKGSPLTSDEVDENFHDLDDRVVDLETNPPLPVSVSNVTETETTFTIWLSDGTSFGPFTKPVGRVKWRGEWQPNTGYFQNDVLYYIDPDIGLTQYFVTQNHVSPTTFDDTLENSDELILEPMFGPISFSTMSNLQDVSYAEGSPAHGDLLRYDASVSSVVAENVWRPKHERIILKVTTATLTLGPEHLGNVLLCTHVDGCVITIPNQSGSNWELNGIPGTTILPSQSGRWVMMIQKGGPITVEAGSSVDLSWPAGFLNNTNAANAVIEVMHTSDPGVSDNDWHLYGVLEQDAAAS